MQEALRSDHRTTIAEFRAFIEDRPDDEKWELIDGEIVLNPAPTNRHQLIVGNLQGELHAIRRASNASWESMPGIGLRHPENQYNEPEPDIMIVGRLDAVANWTSEAMVVFEVLSPFSVRRDMVHKLAFYRTIATLTHYVVLAQERREATVFARSDDFKGRRIASGSLVIEPIGISLALDELYRGVPMN
jgi:Uma2 family endonuclease